MRPLLLVLLILPMVCGAAPQAIVQANDALLDTFRTRRVFAPEASRSLALAHLAAFDVVQEASAETLESRAALAALSVAEALYPQEAPRFAQLRDSMVYSEADLEAAQTAARAVIEERADDGWNATVADRASMSVGQWRQTRPCFRPMLDPQWAHLRPFVMKRPNDFRPPPPPPLNSPEYARDWDEVRRLGAYFSEERGSEGSQIARFWADELGSPTTPGRWNKIATDLAREESFSPKQTVELLAMLNVALADAAIIAWDAKLHYNTWRPVTAIRLADSDENPATTPDPRWASYIKSPPFPEYPSGHSTLSGAGQVVLEVWFGRDRSFVHPNHDLPVQYHQGALERRFASLEAAAEEAAESRLLGGIHFRFANQAGLDAGRMLGTHVVEQWTQLASGGSLPSLVAQQAE